MEIITILLIIPSLVGVLVTEGKAHSSNFKEPDVLNLLNLNTDSPLFEQPDTQPIDSTYSTVDNTRQGFVNMGTLQSFTMHLSAQEKEDVLDTVLYAQLTASRMYDKESEYAVWYKTYVNALIKLGWMIDTYHFFQYDPPDNTFNLAETIVTLLQRICSKSNQLQVAKDLIIAYGHLLSSDHRVSLFTNHTIKLDSGMKAGFQVLPAASMVDGTTTLVFSKFQFSSVKTVTRYLFYNWETEKVNLLAALSVGSLNHTEYALYRNAVKRNIGEATQKFVQEVPLKIS